MACDDDDFDEEDDFEDEDDLDDEEDDEFDDDDDYEDVAYEAPIVDDEPVGPEPAGYRLALAFALVLILAFLGWSLWSGTHEHQPAEAPATKSSLNMVPQTVPWSHIVELRDEIPRDELRRIMAIKDKDQREADLWFWRK